MKGRKVELLPDEIKSVFFKLVESKQFTAQQIADDINQRLADFKGEKLVESIDDNTVWREGKRLDEILRQKTESETMVATLGDKYDLTSLGETGRVLMNMLQSAIFRTSTHLMSGNAPVDPETLGDLILSVSRLQRSAIYNQDLEQRIKQQARKEALEKAAAEMESAASDRNLKPEDIKYIRERLYGIYDEPEALIP